MASARGGERGEAASIAGVLGCGWCCVDVSAVFGNTSDVLLAFSSCPPPQYWQEQAAFFLADPLVFLPSHRQERGGSEWWLV